MQTAEPTSAVRGAMRRREREIIDRSEIDAILHAGRVMRIALVDGDRHWFKSAHGIDVVETPRDSASFCGYAIQSDLPFIVSNALLDSRFAGNPIVAGEINIRFYAGHPLKTPDGNRVGTLCVMDRKPRTLGASQMALLDDLDVRVVVDTGPRAEPCKSNHTVTELDALRDPAEPADARYILLALQVESPHLLELHVLPPVT